MNFRLFAHVSYMAGIAAVVAGCSTAGPVPEPVAGDGTRQVGPVTVQTGIDQYDYLYDDRRRNPLLPDQGTIFSGDNSLLANLRGGRDQNTLPVNKYLWRASLDTLSFMPLSSVDTFSGVIATDWSAAPGATNERVRVTTYVRDAELSASALDVSVFRETLSPGGAWQTAVVDPTVALRLEDAILTRARQLRIEDVDG